MSESSAKRAEHPVRQIGLLFLRLGATAFGGPAAHIALMEEEIVRRRGWLSRDEFLDLLGATNLIPGPNSTEMAIHIGHRRAGWVGLLTAGICFIAPAAILVTGLAWAYVRFGKVPEVAGLLYGVKPVIIAVVAQALWGLGKTVSKRPPLAFLGLAAAGANVWGVHELIVLFAAGALSVIGRRAVQARKSGTVLFVPLAGGGKVSPALLAAVTGVISAVPFTLSGLFLYFLKIGSVLFGSGYVLLAFLQADLVGRWHWLTEHQLLDAVAVGQITPGPLFTTATFIGYLLGGPVGALVATVGIFLPAFVFVAASGPLIPRIRASPTAGAFLDGVNAASVALMAVVSFRLGVAAVVDWPTVLLLVAAGVLLLKYRVNSVWLVLGGGVVGVVRYLVSG